MWITCQEAHLALDHSSGLARHSYVPFVSSSFRTAWITTDVIGPFKEEPGTAHWESVLADAGPIAGS